jgi:hypothetical protein
MYTVYIYVHVLSIYAIIRCPLLKKFKLAGKLKQVVSNEVQCINAILQTRPPCRNKTQIWV